MHDAAEAEDLVQETMIKAFKNLDHFQQGTDMKAWLMTILRRTRVDHLRSASSHEKVTLEQLNLEPQAPGSNEPCDGMSPDDPEAILQAFSDRQVIAALQALPEELRWTLLLVDVEGMEHIAAAKVLDVPVGTVKSRAHRGRAILRSTLLPLAEELRMTARQQAEVRDQR